MNHRQQVLFSVAVGFALLYFPAQVSAKTYFITQSVDKAWCIYPRAIDRNKALGDPGTYLWADMDYDQGRVTALSVSQGGSEFEVFRKDTYVIHSPDRYEVSRKILIPQEQYERTYLYKFNRDRLVSKPKGAGAAESEGLLKLSYFSVGNLIRALEAQPSGRLCTRAK